MRAKNLTEVSHKEVQLEELVDLLIMKERSDVVVVVLQVGVRGMWESQLKPVIDGKLGETLDTRVWVPAGAPHPRSVFTGSNAGYTGS